MHGRSAKEDNRIKKIANTGIVSQQDRDSYRGEMLAEASSLGGTSAVVLMDRKLKSLPQDMLDQRVLENAQYKAKEYKLIPNV